MSNTRRYEITVNGIPVSVRCGDFKHLRITVHPPEGEVRVSAPRRVSQRQIVEFVASRIGWITSARSRLTLPEEPGVWVWGRLVDLEVRLEPGRPRADLTGDALLVQAPERDAVAPAIAAWRKRALASELPALLDTWQPRLGVRASRLTLRPMTTRWGTCNHRTGRLTFNTELTRYDPSCLEYVVVHELAHLIVSGHGPRFRAILDHHLPGWRSRQRLLNQRTGR